MPNHVGINPKKIKAAVLLSAGFSQAKVAEELGISTRTLQRWQKESGFNSLKNNVASEVTNTTVRATAEHLSQDVSPLLTCDERKRLVLRECSLLDLALDSVLPLVESGSLQAIDRLIRISERRCKLLALDQPRSNIIDAMAVLAQHGIINDFQSASVNQILDEADFKLSRIGLVE